jgi:hypothetical protein
LLPGIPELHGVGGGCELPGWQSKVHVLARELVFDPLAFPPEHLLRGPCILSNSRKCITVSVIDYMLLIKHIKFIQCRLHNGV